MKLKIKRFIAFIIDIFIVSIISETLSSINFINIYKEDYKEKYYEYEKIYDSFLEEEISINEYNEKVIYYNFELSKLSSISNTIYMIIFLSYFVGINCLYEGQTIGKKIMNIKIVSENNIKINGWIYLLRTLLITGIFSTFLLTISTMILNKETYYSFSYNDKRNMLH